ncbi:AraC family transcriptional regulator [Archangium violaceum]|uniref:AraC family transcriptional regulator n=1 Tax=Archangium violaceum TaxID=83451 RepID=UPI000695A8EF|nr:AraC family transcriptional regulator [Archangium violaceum]
MNRTPPRSPPHVVTLEEMGAGGLPLRVIRIPGGQVPVIPPGPLVSTFFMIFVMTAGRGRARLLEPLEVHGGDIHLVPPGMEHQPLDMGDLEGWIVGFDPLLLRSLGPEWLPALHRGTGKTQPPPTRSLFVRGLLRLRPGQPRWRRVVHQVAALDAELREDRWGVENAAHAWFVLLVTELLRELQERAPLAPSMSGGLVHEALAFIEAHCLQPLSLQDVAAAVGCTPSHLANVFREETGLTVGDWLREHRMAEARRRLRETGDSIESIASQVGYTDVTHFIRTFRRVHGVTPRAWREQHRR